MTSTFSLSPELTDFVVKTQAFTAAEPGIQGQRVAYRRMCAAFTPPRSPRLRVHDFRIANVPVRLYRPSEIAPGTQAPCVVYLHGGGWVVGGLDSHDFMTASLATDLEAIVIAVDYRLAPEHPFPAAFDDCLAVWQAVQTHARDLDIDPHKVAIAGDSAGANLAAAVCLALRDAGQAQPAGQALVYPALGGAPSLASRTECADAPLLSSADVMEYQSLYLAGAQPTAYAMPLLAGSFNDLAAAFIAVAQFDPLRDDGVAYGNALRNAGVSVSFQPGHGLVHGCLRARGDAREVDDLYQHIVQALRGFIGKASEII